MRQRAGACVGGGGSSSAASRLLRSPCDRHRVGEHAPHAHPLARSYIVSVGAVVGAVLVMLKHFADGAEGEPLPVLPKRALGRLSSLLCTHGRRARWCVNGSRATRRAAPPSTQPTHCPCCCCCRGPLDGRSLRHAGGVHLGGGAHALLVTIPWRFGRVLGILRAQSRLLLPAPAAACTYTPCAAACLPVYSRRTRVAAAAAASPTACAPPLASRRPPPCCWRSLYLTAPFDTRSRSVLALMAALLRGSAQQ